MPDIQYKWNVFCNDESKFIDIWNKEQPIVCPNNNTHTLNHELTHQIHRVNPATVIIREENVPINAQQTNRNYAIRSHDFTVAPGVTYTTSSETFTYPISMLDVIFEIEDTMAGDRFYVDIGRNTIIGALYANASPGDTQLTVSPTVTQYMNNGFIISLTTDGINFTELGPCLNIDNVNNTLTIQDTVTQTWYPGTYVAMSIRLTDVNIGRVPGKLEMARSTVGGVYVPAGQKMTGTYVNRNGNQAEKHIHMYYEFFY